MRARMSVVPPGALSTTSLIGRLGKLLCACAGAARNIEQPSDSDANVRNANVSDASDMDRRIMRVIKVFSLGFYVGL